MDLWRVLNYEFQMYYGVEHLQRSDARVRSKYEALLTPHHAVMTSGLTEIKVLHTRILTEVFLEKSKNRPTDLNIDDLLPNWRNEHPALVSALQSAYKDDLPPDLVMAALQLDDITELPTPARMSPKSFLDKYLAHATTMRGDSLNWKPITRTMDPPLRAIFATLPTEQLPALAFYRDK